MVPYASNRAGIADLRRDNRVPTRTLGARAVKIHAMLRALALAAVLFASPRLLDAQRQCKKGIPCGNSCIAANRTCRIGTSSGSSGVEPRPEPVSPPKSATGTGLGLTADQGGSSTRVWVNASSRVYHCPGTKYYGATARGEYAIEREAVAAGHRPAGGKNCGAMTAEPTAPPADILPVFGDAAARGDAEPSAAIGSPRVRLSPTSRVYFCQGSPEYQASERGAYMTEQDARTAAFQSATGRPCTSGEGLPATPMPLMRRDTAVPSRAETPASGGVKVWANTKSRVYHCPGTRYYGTTANGTYMREQEATANGYRAAGGRACGG